MPDSKRPHPCATKWLVVGPAWVGDMVMAQSLFKCLKAKQPNGHLTVLAPAWSEPVLARMPEVDATLVSPFRHGELRLKERWALGKQLRQHQYDQAILLTNSFKSALVPWVANIPRRTGWLGEYRFGLLNNWYRLDKRRYPKMVDRFMALADAGRLPNTPSDFWPQLVTPANGYADTAALFDLDCNKPMVALCPGAEFGPAKRWPTHHYAEVTNRLLDEGIQIMLCGSAKDMPVSADIQTRTEQRCLDVTGKTNLAQAIDLLSGAHAVVSNDSGLLHIAAALQRPVIALYGPTPEDFAPPLCQQSTRLFTQIACRPCKARTCPKQHHKCMQDLTPAQVLTVLEPWLKAKDTPKQQTKKCVA